MPEFVQEKQRPYAVITVRFEDEYALNLFSSLVDQKLTPKTRSIWFPFKSHFRDVIREWTCDE